MTDYIKLWDDTFKSLEKSQILDRGWTESDVRAGGRATKAYPDKENKSWWYDNGPAMVEAWETWRNTSGYQIAELTPGTPAIEVGINIQLAEVPIQMHIDRVMYMPSADGNYSPDNFVVVDLKSGKNPPKSDFQLGLYAVGLEKVYGWRPRWGAYWMAREGTLGHLIDLDNYPSIIIEDMISQFKLARENKIFMPNFGHCAMCSVQEFCKYRNPKLWEIK